MKFLILITISILSLNVFSAELGENQKGPCPFSPQSHKREQKIVTATDTDAEIVKIETKIISK